MRPEIYDNSYFRSMRGDTQYYSGLTEVNPLYQKALGVIGDAYQGGTVLEFGCGRGEMLKYCLESGAHKVIGVDFSGTAIDLSRQILTDFPDGRVDLRCQDAAEFQLDEPVKLVLMMDFVEHVPDSTLEIVFGECAERLEEDGRVLVHTFPTRGPNDIYHGMVRRGWVGRSLDLEYHVNVQSRASLRRTMEKAGLVVEKMWLETGYLTESNMIHMLGKKYPWVRTVVGLAEGFFNLGPVRWFFRSIGLEEYFYMSIWAVARKKAS